MVKGPPGNSRSAAAFPKWSTAQTTRKNRRDDPSELCASTDHDSVHTSISADRRHAADNKVSSQVDDSKSPPRNHLSLSDCEALVDERLPRTSRHVSPPAPRVTATPRKLFLQVQRRGKERTRTTNQTNKQTNEVTSKLKHKTSCTKGIVPEGPVESQTIRRESFQPRRVCGKPSSMVLGHSALEDGGGGFFVSREPQLYTSTHPDVPRARRGQLRRHVSAKESFLRTRPPKKANCSDGNN